MRELANGIVCASFGFGGVLMQTVQEGEGGLRDIGTISSP